MNHQKLVFLVAATGVGLAVVSGASPANAATAQPSAATKSATQSSAAVSTARLPSKSFPCKSPKKQHLNVSWSKKSHIPGINSTYRFYFNNHCSQKRTISANFVWGTSKASKLIKVNAHTTKGDTTFVVGNAWTLKSVTAH
ncbi:MAG: hypothetical protein JWN52_1977 [Actinomycetia bacterium]|nr:hypothetical protein [Actinomycetes bacterium]